MAKFEVMITENIQRSVQYTVSVTKKEVVDALNLEGDDAKGWKEHVRDYIESEWESLRDRAKQGDVGDEDEISCDVDDVTELESVD
jgi:hypothetical protein